MARPCPAVAASGGRAAHRLPARRQPSPPPPPPPPPSAGMGVVPAVDVTPMLFPCPFAGQPVTAGIAGAQGPGITGTASPPAPGRLTIPPVANAGVPAGSSRFLISPLRG